MAQHRLHSEADHSAKKEPDTAMRYRMRGSGTGSRRTTHLDQGHRGMLGKLNIQVTRRLQRTGRSKVAFRHRPVIMI